MKPGPLLILLAAHAASAAPANLCRIENPGAYFRTSLSSTPSYFFGMFPTKEWISYRGEKSNWVMDLGTGKEFAIPGEEDPIPMPDEKIISTPREMRFYSIVDSRNSKSPEALLNDSDLKGVYQSIGTLASGSAEKPVFRVLTDDNTVSYRDYRVSSAPSGTPSIEKAGDVQVICKGLDLKTPKLSKDGQTLAALDSGASPPTTKIFSILQGGGCSQVGDLGFQTGKVDFSYDATKIVFHAGTNSMGSRGSYREHPEKGDRLDVYEMTLSDHKIRQLTFNGDDRNSYYPVYRKNGDVAYIDQTIQADGREHFDIVVAHTDDIAGIPLKSFLASDSPKPCIQETNDPAVLLGRTWLDICSNLRNVPEEKALLRLRALDSEQCNRFITRSWARIQPEAAQLGLTREALWAACPASTFPKLKKVGPESSIHATRSSSEVFSRKCTVCHGDTIPFDSLADLKKTPSSVPGKSLYDEMIRRLKSDDPSVHMPRGSSLSSHDSDLVMKYLGAR